MAVTIVRTPWIDDDGTGTTGTVINNAVKTALYNDIDGALAKIPADIQASLGLVVDIPFTASDFSTPTGGATWTVTGVATFAYTKIGKTVILWLTILSTGTITGAPVRLRVTLPPAIIPPARASEGVPFIYGLAGASINGTGVCSFNGNQLDFLRDIGGTTFPAGATFLYLTFPYSL